MDRREHETLVHIVDGSVEVFTFSFRSINIVFATHNLEVTAKLAFNIFSLIFVSRIRVNWLASLPIIFGFFIEEAVITDTIRRRFINILDVICVLMGSTSLVEIFLVLSVIAMVVLTISNISSVVPCWNSAGSWLVNAFLESVHIFYNFFIFNINIIN